MQVSRRKASRSVVRSFGKSIESGATESGASEEGTKIFCGYGYSSLHQNKRISHGCSDVARGE